MDLELVFTVAVPVGILVAIIGLVVKFLLDRSSSELEITWEEYTIVVIVTLLISALVVTPIGRNLAVQDLITFHEKWNGSLTGYQVITIPCTRDGPCIHEYPCDSYPCRPHDCNCVCSARDSDGDCISRTCQTCYDTCWRDCPYCTHEYTYVLQSNIGSFTVASNWLPENPDQHRWRSHQSVPAHLFSISGIPEFWSYFRDRLNRNISDPVTATHNYDNYLLASDTTILSQQSTAIASLLEAGLLPNFDASVFDLFNAHKVYFVGWTPGNPDEWYDSVSRLNAALGAQLRGDLYVVVVQNGFVSADPMTYLNALKAYWQNREVFGRNTLAKNSILVVVGTNDGETVSWFRATTGMPVGNERMINEFGRRYLVQSQSGEFLPLLPQTVIGDVRLSIIGDPANNQTEVSTTNGGGYIEDILWGISNPTTRFERVSMSLNDEDDSGPGFQYLLESIKPTSGQRLLMVLVSIAISIPGWVAVAFIGERLGFNRYRFR